MPTTRVGAAGCCSAAQRAGAEKSNHESSTLNTHTTEVCGFREMWTQIRSGLKIDPPIVRQL